MTKKKSEITEIKRQLVYNALRCTECNEILVSFTTHDYKECSCPNKASIDGGLSYARVGAVDRTKVESLRVYADEDFEKVRECAYRGSRGKDGKQPLTWVPINLMSDDYLAAVLEYGGAGWHLELITKELQYRYKHGISISED
jgi:hypothetical protein